MGTIFVAYGEEGRERVLEYAADRAREAGDDLFIYHAQEDAGESGDEVRAEIESIREEAAPDIEAEVVIEEWRGESDETNVSGQKRLTDAIQRGDREWSYVVMGNVRHGTVESFVVPSMTEAVLELQTVPVMLVPV